MKAETVQIRIDNLLVEIEEHMKVCAKCGECERTHILCQEGADLSRLLDAAMYVKGRIIQGNS